MAKTIQVKVYPDLITVFENIRKGIAEEMKKKYKLTEIIIPMTLASQVLAAEKLNKKVFFKVKKTSLTTGELELNYL